MFLAHYHRRHGRNVNGEREQQLFRRRDLPDSAAQNMEGHQSLYKNVCQTREARHALRINDMRAARREAIEQALFRRRDHAGRAAQNDVEIGEISSAMVAALNALDPRTQLEATVKFRKLFRRELKPIDEIIRTRIINKFVEFLHTDDQELHKRERGLNLERDGPPRRKSRPVREFVGPWANTWGLPN